MRRYHVPRLRGKYGLTIDSTIDETVNGGERERYRIRPPTRRVAPPLIVLPERAHPSLDVAAVGARLRRRADRTRLLAVYSRCCARTGGCTTAEIHAALLAEFGPTSPRVARAKIRALRHYHKLETSRRLDPLRGWVFEAI